MGLFDRAEKINASEGSSRVKPIFVAAYDICREFGSEEAGYFNYQYKDNSILIRHSCLEKSQTADAFSPGKAVSIEW